MTDWSKVFEVFGSGIVGVFIVMFFLQILTQLSTKIIDLIESAQQREQPVATPTAVVAKEEA
jgi:hypothetical protein